MLSPNRVSWPLLLWPYLFAVLLSLVAAQATPSSNGPSNTLAPSTFLSLTTATATISTTIRNGTSLIPTVTAVPVVFNVTVTTTPTPSATSATSSSSSAAASATQDPSHLDTKLDPAFGVLGAVLIITGIPSAFLGHKNRWTSFFLIGFYTLSLVCLCLILKFGVLHSINPPDRTLRGLFVLACVIAGFGGGAVSIFFWKATRYFIGAWGGLAFALWIQCFRDGGLIHPIGFRWIMYIGCAVVGFILCTIPKIHYHVILVGTAFVGATSFMLGVDCYASTNLKEFYLWNLGFTDMFPRFVSHHIEFPVSQTMQIELGLLGAVALMGIAVQLRILKLLQRKLKEIREEARRQDAVEEARAAERFNAVEREKDDWEREHPTLSKHARNNSSFSGSPLMKEEMDGGTSGDEKQASTNTLVSPRQRYQSGVSSFMATPVDERQSPGALPTLDLGLNLENDVPQNYIAENVTPPADARTRTPSLTLTALELEDLKKKQELLNEIQNIRKSIEMLKAETPAPSSSSDSRNQSFASGRTLSRDLSSFSIAGPSQPRLYPQDSHARVQSMNLGSIRYDQGNAIGRPTSVPLPDEDWEAYVRERKLLQPPSGVTPPIPTTPLSPTPRVPMSPAVADAILQRQRRESSLSFGAMAPLLDERPRSSSRNRNSPPRHAPEDIPLALRPKHTKTNSQDSYAPGVLLPPRHRRGSSPPPEDAPRVMSFEELAERHKEKLHELQKPLTQQEKEQAEIAAARARWERAKELEKQAVAARQADKAAALAHREARQKHKEKDRHSVDVRGSTSLDPNRGHSHSRSLSANALASVGGLPASSKRMSTMKVQDWQRHQLEDEEEDELEHPDRVASTRRLSAAVPFPDTNRGRPSRDSRRHSNMPRDPPS